MEMTATRRSFIGGATAVALRPASLFGAARTRNHAYPGNMPVDAASAWEKPDGCATDCVMVRRLHLDLAGRMPTAEEARNYVESGNPNKLESLVERLLDSEDFTDFWTMRFCDILRVKSEFPVNLWPNAVYAYHSRIRSFVKNNERWDDFGRALLSSQGSNFRDPEVNFFRATDMRTPEGWAEAVAQTFLGIEPGSLDGRTKSEIASLLKCVRIKNTREWKEEVVYADGADRRGELCDMLFRGRGKDVAGAFHVRVNEWMFGPGAKPAKQASEPRLKDELRSIALSREYSRGSISGGFPVRRIEAEVLDDIFCSLGDGTRNYQSPAPEPFTFLPPDRRTICIEDGSISSGFLTLFGRPPRDTGLMDERESGVTAKQRLYLFNSGTIARRIRRIAAPPGKMPDGSPNPEYKKPLAVRIENLYWRILSRPPTQRERDIVVKQWKRPGWPKKAAKPSISLVDVAWCLVNTKEFLFRT